jgi:hypothetical protein
MSAKGVDFSLNLFAISARFVYSKWEFAGTGFPSFHDIAL